MRGMPVGFSLTSHKSVSRAERVARGRRENSRSLKLEIWADEPPAEARVPIFEASRAQCRWPYGEGVDLLVCAQAVVPGLSWCAYHLRRVMPRSAAEALIRSISARSSDLSERGRCEGRCGDCQAGCRSMEQIDEG